MSRAARRAFSRDGDRQIERELGLEPGDLFEFLSWVRFLESEGFRIDWQAAYAAAEHDRRATSEEATAGSVRRAS